MTMTPSLPRRPRWRSLALLALCLAPLLWPLNRLAEHYYQDELASQNRQTLDLYVANLLGTLHRYEALPQILGDLPTLRDVLAILELRISLEVESAGMAAARRTDAQLKAIREALDAINESAAHASDAVSSDFQFHLRIAEATGNRYFTDILSHLGTSIIPRTRVNSASLARDDQSHYMARLEREHEQILSLIHI